MSKDYKMQSKVWVPDSVGIIYQNTRVRQYKYEAITINENNDSKVQFTVSVPDQIKILVSKQEQEENKEDQESKQEESKQEEENKQKEENRPRRRRSNKRPTFILKGGRKVRSGGLLLYRYNKEIADYEFLMVKYEKKRAKYEDIGGKTAPGDKSHIDTICREVYEETNGKIEKEEIQGLVKDVIPLFFYVGGKGGHVVYIVEKDIGEREYGEKDIEGRVRKLQWLNFNEIRKQQIKEIVSLRLSSLKKFRLLLNQLEINKSLMKLTIN